ncbi:MAG TPA: sugar ABC transporter ATP-binding protein [Aggregatilineales bacterium]|mgnify:CR=1 FL=1|nr:sugar ABC transporter ATP-binding protein [Aggregatilineales bacterium]
MTDSTQILKVEEISKRYGGVQALNKVNFELNYGEVHALVGENGAGKSTLIKVLGGIVPRDSGRITFEGREVVYNSPAEAQAAGIAIIHQELSMMPHLSVIENLFMHDMSRRLGMVRWRDMQRRAREALALVDLHVPLNASVQSLPISQRQMIEIARALTANAKLIIMDEPNSSLSDTETERLFALIHSLKARGIAIIYVSHKIDEVLAISDRITVFRDGGYIGTIDTVTATEQKVINMMVGRELDRSAISVPTYTEEVLLEVRDLCGPGYEHISFDVRKGEIVAFSGLIGAGRSEVMSTIFGAAKRTAGEIRLKGKPVRFRSPADAIHQGIAMVQEDRKVLSLFMDLPIAHNVSMAQLPRMTRTGTINHRRERSLVNDFVKQLDVRLASISNAVGSLSGGNQQKTVLARWLATLPKLLILDEPTHGVDVGAKAEIYELIRALARSGVGIILVSSELPEVLALAHRVAVMHEGRLTGILDRSGASEETLMAYATGVRDDFAKESAT